MAHKIKNPAFGELITSWAKGSKMRHGATDLTLSKFKVGDSVCIIGTVVGVSSTNCKLVEGRHSEIVIAIKETRKLPSDT